jgi:phage-related protein (TIGR01555 family)
MEKPKRRPRAAMNDSLTNVVANLGTARDKAAWSTYEAQTLSAQALLNAYRGAWLPRKIVDIPALDSCRNWRDWQAQKPEIDRLEAEERRLALKQKVLAARTAARLYGGAALLIVTGETDYTKPLRPETVKQGGLRSG